MTQTVTVVFDGKVLRPESPLDLEPHTRYEITIREASPKAVPGDAWDMLEQLAGVVDVPADWSAEHDHYLYGTPKSQGEATE